MWIFFNDGIKELKIPVLTTLLRTMWKTQRAGHRLSQPDLVEGKQKTETLSLHLKSACLAGVIYKIKGNAIPINDGFISEPNEYIPLNPTHKINIAEYSEINEAFSFALQETLGVKQTKYYKDKFSPIAPADINIQIMTHEDWGNYRLAYSLEAPQLGVPRVICFTKPHYGL
ncbi:MAG: hypothetical protein IJ785_05205 [Bacteroidales bacterium]|nr:hypothetical protein [Bacteroidales bacterium]